MNALPILPNLHHPPSLEPIMESTKKENTKRISLDDDNVLDKRRSSEALSVNSVNGLQYCPNCEDMHASECNFVKTCSVCNINSAGSPGKEDRIAPWQSFDTCVGCKKVTCGDRTSCSSSYFDCEYCDRHLCGGCVTNIPCEGAGCTVSNCMECAENGDGDVLKCTYCGHGFCTVCKPMEFCFCLEGDTCRECHAEMHDYDVETYWRHLPPEMKQVVGDFAVDISGESLADFWKECIQFLPADRQLDKRLYRRSRRARAASLILASHHLLKGQEKEALYLILFAALLEEAWNRGVNYFTRFFESDAKPSSKSLATYFTSFHSVIEHTTTKASIVMLLHNQLSSIREKEGRKLFECINFALGKVEKSSTPIHNVPIPTAQEIEQEFSDHSYDGDYSLSMNIITCTVDDSDTKQKSFVYKDMTLEWWLKIYVIKCSYHNWLSEESPITAHTKFFRVFHQGKSIFVSADGKRTLRDLGIKNDDEIMVEGVEIDDFSYASYESKTCDIVSTCSRASSRDGDLAAYDACHGCDKVVTGDSPSFFDCMCCERLLCGECVADIPCEGDECDLSNCMECAENGDGDVLYCTNCGRGYCTDCKPMEFCFCLVGDTCPGCHTEMHKYDVECYWQHLPSEVQEVIAEFAADDISKDRVIDFWYRCVHFLPPDKEFDIHQYRTTRQTRAAALILASDQLLNGGDKEAIYLLLYASQLEEVWHRGADYMKRAYEKSIEKSFRLSAYQISMYYNSFRSVIESSTTKANLVAYLHNQIPSVHEKEGKELLKCMDFALSKMQKSNTQIHSVPILSVDDDEQEFMAQFIEGSFDFNMNVTIYNMDTGRREERPAYKDMHLGWWMKIYVIQSSYQTWLRNPDVPPSTKQYFRVVHKGNSLFLSSAGKKSLCDLGVSDGDEIVVGGVVAEEEDANENEGKSTKKKGANKTYRKKTSGGKKKKSSKARTPPPSLTEEQLMEKYRQAHSQTMTPVFDELGPLLKDIRMRLNNLTLKKSAPKVRRTKVASQKSQQETAAPTLPPAEDTLGGKAGKVAYPVVVGEVTNLYKTSKALAKTVTVDLHGHTKEEATKKLDESLPGWVDVAMKGDYPFIHPVDIICGGGTQTLSEVVQTWIRSNRQVANRPKHG